MVKTDTQIEEQIRAIFSGDTPWVTIVWDDLCNLRFDGALWFLERESPRVNDESSY